MYDLSSTLFFKGKFEIAAAPEKTGGQEDFDLLWCVVCHVRDWMRNKWIRREPITRKSAEWTKWKFGSTISSKNDLVRFYSIYFADEQTGQINWACTINERFPSRDDCAPRSWTTEVGYQSTGENQAALSIVIYYSDRPGFIGPCEPPTPASVPNLIRNMIADPALVCTVDSHPLTMRPVLLEPGDVPAFWKVVSDERREIPVVYISPRKTEEEDGEEAGGANLIDPQELAWNILGPNALVYYAEDPEFSWEMRQLRPDYGCYGGSIRIYAPQPHVEEADDQLRHRYIPSRSILEKGPEQTCEILRRALAQDVSFYSQMFRVENCRELRDRHAREQRMQKYRESLERDKQRFRESMTQEMEQYKGSVAQEMEQYKDSMDQALEKYRQEVADDLLNSYGGEMDTLDARCKEQAEKLQDLGQQLRKSQDREELLKQKAEQARENAMQILRPVFQEYPAEPKAIAGAVMALYPGRIDFTERGWKSLEKQCEDKDPAMIWKVLLKMATTLYDLFNEDGGGSAEAFNRRCEGLSLALSEGSQTRQNSKLMKQYEDKYQGREIHVEPHIKTSQSKEESKYFLRVYFCPHTVREETVRNGKKEVRESLRIVIGSIGDHFTTAGTKRMH